MDIPIASHKLSGPKVKKLNKETVSWALLGALDLPDEVIGEIVEIVWRSDELLEAHQNYVSRLNTAQQKDAADFRKARGVLHIEGLDAVEEIRKARGG